MMSFKQYILINERFGTELSKQQLKYLDLYAKDIKLLKNTNFYSSSISVLDFIEMFKNFITVNIDVLNNPPTYTDYINMLGVQDFSVINKFYERTKKVENITNNIIQEINKIYPSYRKNTFIKGYFFHENLKVTLTTFTPKTTFSPPTNKLGNKHFKTKNYYHYSKYDRIDHILKYGLSPKMNIGSDFYEPRIYMYSKPVHNHKETAEVIKNIISSSKYGLLKLSLPFKYKIYRDKTLSGFGALEQGTIGFAVFTNRYIPPKYIKLVEVGEL